MSDEVIVWGLLVPFFIFAFSFVITYAIYRKFSKRLGSSNEKSQISNSAEVGK